MTDARASAAINLHAVLRNLEDLCELDPAARALVADTRLRLTFKVPGLPSLALSFADGQCRAQRSDAKTRTATKLPPVVLAFATPAHFNAMVAGKGFPIPLRGVRHLAFLTGPFTKLTTLLEQVLRPDADRKADADAMRISTTLTAYAAFFALAEIGNYDPIGKLNAGRIADGTISVTIGGGPSVHLICQGGHLVAGKGAGQQARASMHFDSIETAGKVLASEVDTYACIGDGRLSISGFVPMIDDMNKLLGQVGRYLS